MTQEVKIIIGIALTTILIVILGVFFLNRAGNKNTPTTSVDSQILINENSHKIASDSAKVTIVEFGDYQCPACLAAQPAVDQILKDYQGKINFIFRNFPLPQHINAKISAEAAEAAGTQGKFWEMHDKLYQTQNIWAANQNPLGLFTQYAKELNLDEAKFTDDVKNNKYEQIIAKDQSDGQKLGVDSTPTFFINNDRFLLPPTYSNIKNKIVSLL